MATKTNYPGEFPGELTTSSEFYQYVATERERKNVDLSKLFIGQVTEQLRKQNEWGWPEIDVWDIVSNLSTGYNIPFWEIPERLVRLGFNIRYSTDQRGEFIHLVMKPK